MSRIFRSNEALVAVTIVLLSLVIGLNNPTFFSVGNLFDLLRSSIVLGIFAMGVLIVIISGGIDVSFTAIGIFAMYSTTRILKGFMPEAPIWVAFMIAGAIGLGLGMVNAFFIARFRLPTLIVTLGTLSMYHGFLLFAIGNQIIRDVPPAMDQFARSALVRIPLERGVANLHPAILITAAAALVVWFLLNFTMLGRGIYALGGSREAAERAGFNVPRIQYFIYSFVGLLSGIAGMTFGSLARQANPQDIVGTELNVIAAVVLGGAQLTGGRGTVIGTILGVLLVVIASNSLILIGVPTVWQRVVIGLIILIGTGLPAIQARRAAQRGASSL
ncbi:MULTISPECIES: ABC transporter permease [Caldilinea]|uniref:Putative ABC transporter permease protein n=1 Tax=Caldilinea aerophila (strain DSM 14535 / JCM 11387 / NBRC 104270 / STL-6-O1) TaxID=926550 RepID=I0I9G4_CALAS|nr:MULTISPECIES: ABC transporter permease [Caldilinea]BAM01902.1 putative ABC transporter permease protein [Caldilinea aerophila DSM 14535 = NBRC 104270]GIV73241.1 MAG: monosaccharide-transporting ATPase [Caldilinea sp.]